METLVAQGDDRIHQEQEVGAALDRQVDVRHATHPAVHEIEAADGHRLEIERQRGGGGDRVGDRHVPPAGRAEQDPLAGVEVNRRDVELALEGLERVDAAGAGQEPAQIGLVLRQAVEAGREVLLERVDQAREGELLRVAPVEADERRHHPERLEKRALDLLPVDLEDVVLLEVQKAVGVVDDRPADLAGGDPVGDEGGDDRPAARPDVDVEVVDRERAGEKMVERLEGAELVHSTGNTATGQDQAELRLRAILAHGATPSAGEGRAGVAAAPAPAARGSSIEEIFHSFSTA